ncbi:UDP-glucose 6-dehydrogenase, partial [Candidatus Micrarchaeota archaeon CG08_land_8_20_14_0_20_49_17]
MKICVIGSGYVGLITACGFAKLGHQVVCVDIDRKKVELINNAKPPIYEEGLDALLSEVVGKNLRATTDLASAISNSELVFITVGTPSKKDGSIDLSHVEKAFLEAVSAIPRDSNPFKIIAIKSTVVPGTTDSLAERAEEKTGKKAGTDYGLCMNPEFLREGKAIEDFFNPGRIVLGVPDGDKKTAKKMRELYCDFKCPIVTVNPTTAEMVKYASNSFLATKVSFSNEIGNLCKKLGIDTYKVMDAVGLDKRIGRQFLNSGIGYGGSCFPKDVKALIAAFKKNGIAPKILTAVVETNELQPSKLMELAKRKTNLKGKKVAVLGLAFKPESDDMREAPSVAIINSLLAEGAKVMVYDPQAMANAKKIFGERVEYASDLNDALSFSDVVFLLTEWAEFKDDAALKLYAGKMVFDGRKVLGKKSEGNYEGIC